ncbi:related to aspartate-tRNA ligase, cytosolic [Cephalotrichum gorgonifer]|uniref:Probable aspartate--tRNA ligase, cytoplasmic n=1 Tax=Cephalotrichum gorgonifer TaxID=2041049 RepID=A0AAE8N6S8_9PEZI|nr:related to aspartate-tRNA ligase, cytosolic [Cephalotrichum gorgonifer]
MAPTSLKKPLLALNRLVGHTSAKNHLSKPTVGNISALDEPLKHQAASIAREQERQERSLQREDDRRSLHSRRRDEEACARASDDPRISDCYGTMPEEALHPPPGHFALADLQRRVGGGEEEVGSRVAFTARIHHVRPMSSRLAFIVFRQRVDTLQGVLQCREGAISEGFVRWAEHLVTEGIVHVSGTIQRPTSPVTGCTISSVEILIDTLHLAVPVKDHLPVDVHNIDIVHRDDETEKPEYNASSRVRMANRISFLRTPTAQSIFCVNATICSAFRSALESRGFVEIHTPKLQGSMSESGAEVFRTEYYGRTAFLAQSPQLSKQMAICSDFERVYEVGPVFRAEESNTHRHLSEYTGLDLEMVIDYHYHEAMDVIDDVLKNIFTQVYARNGKEIATIKTHFPHDDLVWLDETPRLTFQGGISLLNASGWTDEKGRPASPLEDLGTRAEIRLGELVREKYHTDYYILDKFPASARPFYTQLDPSDARLTNSFDIFLRGQEITTGGQRIHTADALASRMRELGIDPSTMEEYMRGFEYGALPHAGCGIGLERVVFLLLNLGDIRNASLFPRDPKSLPEPHRTPPLPHPEADTIRYSFRRQQADRDEGLLPEPPTLEKLIANYGDATSTSWLDDRYLLWRHDPTGAIIGYSDENGYAIVTGDPLCDAKQFPAVIRAFLLFLRKEKDLRPLWILASPVVEEILGARLGWRTLSCVAEERVPVNSTTRRVAKKQRQATDAGVTIHELGRADPVPESFRARCDARIEDWKAHRDGKKQVHLTEIRPWVDMEHRQYLWAEDRQGEIVALVVLHRLAPRHGYQIKFALDFPGSPGGSIESLISRSIQSLARSGVETVTFGAGAVQEVEIGSNLHGLRARVLSRTYKMIAKELKLLQKSEFREKFGVEEDPVYICYPPLGLGVSGTRTLIKFFEDEM